MAFRKDIVIIIMVAFTIGIIAEGSSLPYQFLQSPQSVRNYTRGADRFPSPDPLTKVTCKEAGFQPYPVTDVTNKYILCIKYPRLGWYFYVFECPNGSRFDKGKKICRVVSNPPTTEDPCRGRQHERFVKNYDESEEIICL